MLVTERRRERAPIFLSSCPPLPPTSLFFLCCLTEDRQTSVLTQGVVFLSFTFFPDRQIDRLMDRWSETDRQLDISTSSHRTNGRRTLEREERKGSDCLPFSMGAARDKRGPRHRPREKGRRTRRRTRRPSACLHEEERNKKKKSHHATTNTCRRRNSSSKTP